MTSSVGWRKFKPSIMTIIDDVFPANPLLINSSMQPDLTVSRTYTSPMCFQDSIDKELMAERSLLDPLPDLKVKGQ